MTRRDYYHDAMAPPANSLVVGTSVIAVDDEGRLLLQRRRDSGPGHVFAYDDGEVRQQFNFCFVARIVGGVPTATGGMSQCRVVQVPPGSF